MNVLDTSNNTKLSIRQSIDSFVFLSQSVDGVTSRLEGGTLGDAPSSLEDATFISSTKRVVIIPAAFYSEESKEDIIQSQMDYNSSNDQIYTSDIDAFDAKCLFVVEKNKINVDQKSYTFTHDAQWLIGYFRQFVQNMPDFKSGLLVNVADKIVQIVAFKDREFQLFNSFDFTSKADFLYYVLLIANQLDIQTTDTQIILSGDNSNTSILTESLKGYFDRVDMASRPIGCIAEQYNSQDLIIWQSLM